MSNKNWRRRYEVIATNQDHKPRYCGDDYVRAGDYTVVDVATSAEEAYDLEYAWQRRVPIEFRVTVI